jgi:glyoxylase-like metal-dependent hydrolase (beta-lactamase superfamily II)/rhodanese-related sulfurtransferase
MELMFSQLNPHACRTYLIGKQDSFDIAIIDPVLDHVNDYVNLLDQKNWNLLYVIDTHTHADHISGGPSLKDIFDCEYIMHERSPSKCATQKVKDDDELVLFGIKITIMHTPGHTKDSISLILPHKLLTGDALFLDSGGAGRDDLPGGNPAEHWETIQKFLKLPEELIVYPAHEYRNRQPSSLGQQKKTNPHMKPRTKDEFISYIEDLKLGPADWMKDVLKANYACARDPKAVWIPVDVPACEVKGTLDQSVNDIQVATISVEELNHRLNSDDKPLLLDVREEKELRSELGHLEGIIHIPIASLTAHLGDFEPKTDQEIIMVCRSGARAYTAAQIMTQVGFKNVKVLEGGMLRWNELGLPVNRQWKNDS